MAKKLIDELSAEDLAAALVGADLDDYDIDDVEVKLMEKYACELTQFRDLVSDLIHMIVVSKSPLTDTVYKGFGLVDGKGHGRFLAKIEIEEGE